MRGKKDATFSNFVQAAGDMSIILNNIIIRNYFSYNIIIELVVDLNTVTTILIHWALYLRLLCYTVAYYIIYYEKRG